MVQETAAAVYREAQESPPHLDERLLARLIIDPVATMHEHGLWGKFEEIEPAAQSLMANWGADTPGPAPAGDDPARDRLAPPQSSSHTGRE